MSVQLVATLREQIGSISLLTNAPEPHIYSIEERIAFELYDKVAVSIFSSQFQLHVCTETWPAGCLCQNTAREIRRLQSYVLDWWSDIF